MNDYTIFVKTCKALGDIGCLLANIRKAEPYIADRLVPTCAPERNIAQDMNWCLDHCETPIAIFCDDDLADFPRLFASSLARTLEEGYAVVSAKLLDNDGMQFMGGVPQDKPTGLTEAHWLPSACIAVWRDGPRFDESLAACDDVDYCAQIKDADPNAALVVDNDVQVTHRNEQKWNKGDCWARGRKQFEAKWGRKIP